MMSKKVPYLLYFIILLFVTACNHKSSGPATEKSGMERAFQNTYVVIVGIDNYQVPGATSLRFAVADANRYVQYFKGRSKGDKVYLMTNDKATRNNIVNLMTHIGKNIKPNDRFIFCFSGHGTPGSIVMHDGLLNQSIWANAIKKIKCSYKMLIIDACFSESMAEDQHHSKPKDQSTEVIVLSSSSDRETSLEHPAKGQGIFTYYMIKGLRGAADYNSDGIVWLNKELFRYVNNNVRAFAKKGSHTQTPKLKERISASDIVIAYL